MGFSLGDLNPIKGVKKLAKKSIDLGEKIFPGMLAIGGAISGGGWGKAAEMLGSGLMARESAQNAQQYQEQINRENIALQREFAQKGVRWRVADAKAAGLNPLAALGFQGPTFQSQVGSYYEGPSFSEIARGMGQGINNARLAKATQAERQQAAARDAALFDAELRGANLRNEGQAIANAEALSNFVRQRELPPPMPASASVRGNKDLSTVDLERPMEDKNVVPSMSWAITPYGYQAVPSPGYKQAIEDMGLEMEWYVNNSLAPRINASMRHGPPDSLKRPDEIWKYNAIRNTWYAVPKAAPQSRDGTWGDPARYRNSPRLRN